MRNLCANDIAAQNSRKLIAVGPVFGLMLDIKVELTDLERFEGDRRIAIELDVDLAEVVFAAIGRQVGAFVVSACGLPVVSARVPSFVRGDSSFLVVCSKSSHHTHAT